jgi:gluconolactonase
MAPDKREPNESKRITHFVNSRTASKHATNRHYNGGAIAGPDGRSAARLGRGAVAAWAVARISFSRSAHRSDRPQALQGQPGTGAVERVATGFRWAEGPAYLRAGHYSIFSDIPNNRQMRLLDDYNHLSVFRSPSYNSNGNTVDRQGRLITCQHGGRRVVLTKFDGRITIITDSYNGKKLNAPNDVVVASDDSIWFSDPMYGISGNYEGLHAEQEQSTQNVYRVDARSGVVKMVVDDFTQPNGLAFSPDETKLYIVDSGITHGGETHIRVFDVDVDVASGSLARGKVFVDDIPKHGFTDGLRLDIEGNVWTSMGWADPREDGVRCVREYIHLRLYVNTHGAVLP